MFARIELGVGAPADLVRLLPLLGLEPVLLEHARPGSVIDADFAADPASNFSTPDTTVSPAAPGTARPAALRVEFAMQRASLSASGSVVTVALIERDSPLESVARNAPAADFVCHSAIAAACFILSRALRLPAPLLTTNPRLFGVICAAVAIAHSPAGVLVEGEIGVGKESMIKLIHGASGEPQSLLYAECAGLEAASVAAEISPLLVHAAGSNRAGPSLYGLHRRDPHLDNPGNYADKFDDPGSARSRAGDPERPPIPLGRTIFFNHLGELSLAAQRNLLEVLRAAPPNLRLLAASVQPLAAMVARGAFRAELHQLFDATLTIPPLRDRPDDLPMLARHILRTCNPAVTLDSAAIGTLARYPFPGNLRELTNFVTRLAIVPSERRHFSSNAAQNPPIGRAEVLRQLDLPSLKLLWRSRHHRAPGLRTSSRSRHHERLEHTENNPGAGPFGPALVTSQSAQSPTGSPHLTTATVPLTTTAVPRLRHPHGVPKSPA